MTGLVIKLKPNEKVLINGVVLQNGDRAASIRVRTDDVAILRARDAITKEDAVTPLTRIYYIAQLAMAGEADPRKANREICEGIEALKTIFSGEVALDLIRAEEASKAHKFFVVMRAVKKHFELEQTLLNRASPTAALAS
ncbi:flagellar biosynthesis repressor FlbT [Hyphococcus lacteus]|uniref:Flagellar biosynthesis repressor FlbT n=1 Tax=Hyphococcus lacteus TaxID=3143536 RepID=A0ABV3Z8F8_9PROT